MSDPEPDAEFRIRLLRVVAEKDRHLALVAAGAYLDQLASKYDRFRTGVPLKGFGTDGLPSRSEAVRRLVEGR